MNHVDLKAFRRANKLNQTDVAKALDTGQSMISKYELNIERSTNMLHALIDAYPTIIEYEIPEIQEKAIAINPSSGNIMHIPQAAEAGFSSGAYEGIIEDDIERWSIPGLKGDCYSFVVSGDSMMDTLRSGEIIITSRTPIKRMQELQNDYIYVFQLKDGIKVKRVGKHSDPNMLWLFSDNEDYKDEEIHASEIINVYLGRRILSFNLSHKMRYE